MKKEDIEKVLAKIRPNIQLDGGDIELVDFDKKNGIVKVRFKGACVGCPMSTLTLENVVGQALKEKVPGFKEVQAV